MVAREPDPALDAVIDYHFGPYLGSTTESETETHRPTPTINEIVERAIRNAEESEANELIDEVSGTVLVKAELRGKEVFYVKPKPHSQYEVYPSDVNSAGGRIRGH